MENFLLEIAEMKKYKFYCLVCKSHFNSNEYEFGRWKNGRNYIRAKHECGIDNYRMLSRREKHEIKYNLRDEG